MILSSSVIALAATLVTAVAVSLMVSRRRRRAVSTSTSTSTNTEKVCVSERPVSEDPLYLHVMRRRDVRETEILETCAPDEHARVEELFVMVPGNPGVCEVYDEFLCALRGEWQRGSGEKGGRVAAVCIGYASHSFRHGSSFSYGKYSLKEQIEHIREGVTYLLRERYINVKRVYIGGHSVGCYVITQLLAEESKMQCIFERVFLLFPTVHNIGLSPNGRKNAMVKYEPVLLGLAHLLDMALLRSSVVKRMAITLLSWISDGVRQTLVNPVIGHRVEKFMHIALVANIVHMARHEFAQIRDLSNVEPILRDNLDRTYVYFSASDRWTPMSFVDDIKRQVYQNDKKCMDQHIAIDPEGTHAFVIHRRDIAVVSKWIADKLC